MSDLAALDFSASVVDVSEVGVVAVGAGGGNVVGGATSALVPMLSRPSFGSGMSGRSGRLVGNPGVMPPAPGNGAGRLGVCFSNQARNSTSRESFIRLAS